MKIRVPKGMLETPCASIFDSGKILNVCGREGWATVGDLVDAINTCDFSTVRGLGKKGVDVLKNGVLNYILEAMTTDELTTFLLENPGLFAEIIGKERK